MKKNKIIIAIVAFWLVLLLGFIISKEFVFYTGNTITIETEPVDPRDFFRGDYVILSYPFSTIRGSEYKNIQESYIKEGDSIYVSFNRVASDKYIPGDISLIKPNTGIFIKGKVSYVSEEQGYQKDLLQNMLPSDIVKIIGVDYGIESFFVKEKTGNQFDTSQKLWATIVVSKNGNAIIKSLAPDSDE